MQFTSKGGGGLARNIWHMTEVAAFVVKSYCCYRYCLSWLLQVYSMIYQDWQVVSLRQYRACVVDSLGLWITCNITVLCVQGILILSPFIFMPSLYSTFEFFVRMMCWKKNNSELNRGRMYYESSMLPLDHGFHTEVVCKTIHYVLRIH